MISYIYMPHDKTKDRDIFFTRLLHGAGYKATGQRLEILKLLGTADKPITIPQLVKRLRRQAIDLVTAYRTLTLLKEKNLVRQIDFQHGITYYELASSAEHHHIICTNCNRVEDIQDCCVAADMHASALRQSGFAAVSQHSLEFYGLCQECK